jgi:hypothetical protein
MLVADYSALFLIPRHCLVVFLTLDLKGALKTFYVLIGMGLKVLKPGKSR